MPWPAKAGAGTRSRLAPGSVASAFATMESNADVGRDVQDENQRRTLCGALPSWVQSVEVSKRGGGTRHDAESGRAAWAALRDKYPGSAPKLVYLNFRVYSSGIANNAEPPPFPPSSRSVFDVDMVELRHGTGRARRGSPG